MINSRLSDGERSDQLERARNGEISIMVGPRSALFTPFSNLGLIIVDEEQEGAYNSEQIPRYHTRETADKLAQLTNSLLLLHNILDHLIALHLMNFNLLLLSSLPLRYSLPHASLLITKILHLFYISSSIPLSFTYHLMSHLTHLTTPSYEPYP